MIDTQAMPKRGDNWLATRTTLLHRLHRWDDQESWREFFDAYSKLIYSAAMKAGLNDADAQDVVQDTVIAVAKKIEGFRYDRAVDSFKGWLLYLTRKRIALHYRRRERDRGGPASSLSPSPLPGIEFLPDPAGADLEKMWNDEWEKHLRDAALAKVKQQVNLKQFQIFDFYVLKEWPAREVAKTLEVTLTQVYVAKHRVAAALQKELKRLRNGLI